MINRSNNRIELTGLHLPEGYPIGRWTGYTKQGVNGTVTATSFTLQAKKTTPTNTSGGNTSSSSSSSYPTFVNEQGRTVEYSCDGGKPAGTGWNAVGNCWHRLK